MRPLPLNAIVAVALLGGLSLLAPLLLWSTESPLLGSTYGLGHRPYELLGLTGSAALGGVAVWMARSRRTVQAALPVLLPLLAVAFCLGQVVEYSDGSWDWRCYQEAAQAVAAGHNPYGGCYIYPLLLAQVLAALLQGVTALCGALQIPSVWAVMLYLYQGSQILAVGMVALLGWRLLQRMGVRGVHCGALVAGLLICNTPLLRTLRHEQINLWVLALWMLAADLSVRRPWIAGFVLALAGHIKLYPMVLVLPWLLARRWRAAAAAGLAFVLLLLVQTGGGQHLDVWLMFTDGARQIAWGEHFRDNSPYAITINFIRAPAQAAGVATVGWLAFLRPLGMIAGGLCAAALLARLARRARREPAPDRALHDELDLYALPLLLSPLVWEHHYLFALPLAWRAAARHPQQWSTWVGISLIFLVPTFDIFILSDHRIVGLLLLLWGQGEGEQRSAASAAS